MNKIIVINNNNAIIVINIINGCIYKSDHVVQVILNENHFKDCFNAP